MKSGISTLFVVPLRRGTWGSARTHTMNRTHICEASYICGDKGNTMGSISTTWRDCSKGFQLPWRLSPHWASDDGLRIGTEASPYTAGNGQQQANLSGADGARWTIKVRGHGSKIKAKDLTYGLLASVLAEMVAGLRLDLIHLGDRSHLTWEWMLWLCHGVSWPLLWALTLGGPWGKLIRQQCIQG